MSISARLRLTSLDLLLVVKVSFQDLLSSFSGLWLRFSGSRNHVGLKRVLTLGMKLVLMEL